MNTNYEIMIGLDPIVALLIVVIYSIQQFNTWPQTEEKLISGSPSDYINSHRFIQYCLLYGLSVVIVVLALYGIPALTEIPMIKEILKQIGFDQESKTFTIFALAAIAIIKIPGIKNYEHEWRKKLHALARIPRDVDDLKRNIDLENRFNPTKRYIELAEKQIKKAGMALQPEFKALETGWLEYLKNYQTEKQNKTIHWQYLNTLILMVIAKETCNQKSLNSTDDFEKKLTEIGSKLLSFHIHNYFAVAQNLSDISDYYTECICKQVVKQHTRANERYLALENYGFTVSHQDFSEPKLGLALAYCIAGVSFVSVVSVALLQLVLLNSGSIPHFSAEQFATWSIGSFLSFSCAILVGAIIAAHMKVNKTLNMISGLIICLILSTLASALYFLIVQDLNARSVGNPVARVTLAFSFALLSPFVYRAITHSTLCGSDVIKFSVLQGFIAGLCLMLMQCLVSITFNIESFNYVSFATFISEQNHKMAFTAAIGFGKGFLLTTFISYLIQKTKQQQFFESLRANPRVSTEIPLRLCELNDTVLTKDISKKGIRLEANAQLKVGDEIHLESANTGAIHGLVKWTKRKAQGKILAGVYISDDHPLLNNFLRENFGPQYAQ